MMRRACPRRRCSGRTTISNTPSNPSTTTPNPAPAGVPSWIGATNRAGEGTAAMVANQGPIDERSTPSASISVSTHASVTTDDPSTPSLDSGMSSILDMTSVGASNTSPRSERMLSTAASHSGVMRYNVGSPRTRYHFSTSASLRSRLSGNGPAGTAELRRRENPSPADSFHEPSVSDSVGGQAAAAAASMDWILTARRGTAGASPPCARGNEPAALRDS